MNSELKTYLENLRAYGLKHDVPNVTDEVGQFLNMMIQVRKPKRVLEIGCANGYSTIWMAEAAKKTDTKVHTIDHSKPTFEQAKNNLEETGLSECVIFHFGDAVEVISEMPASQQFDFVFVDGEKASYLNFWNAIENRLLNGAVVVFDDMMAFPQKTQAFYEFIQTADGVDQLLIPIDGDDGILLVIKK